MNRQGRVAKSFSNITSGISANILMILLGIISRKIFITYLGIEILGINGVISSIISMLNLVELGVGTAISQSLYVPLGKKDYDQVHAIMNLFVKMYKYVALAVFAIGIAVFPFLKYIVKTQEKIGLIAVIYMIYLINAVSSYFISYRRNILLADQKGSIINNVSMACSIFVTILQIIFMIVTGDFIVYLLISVLNNVFQNIYLYMKTNNMYPYLIEKKEVSVDKAVKERIYRNVKALFVARVSMYLVYSTDNIIISSFVGTVMVGIYSNYILILNPIKQVISQIFNGVTPSFGNYLVTNKLEESLSIFCVMQFINFWISTFVGIGFLLLFNPTIDIWLGEGMVFEKSVVFAIVLGFYLDSMRSAIETARNAAGMYSPYPMFKYLWLFQAMINIVLSVLLAFFMENKILGVFLATCVSHILPTIVVPRDMFVFVFKKSGKEFYVRLANYYITGTIIAIICVWLSNIVTFCNRYTIFAVNLIIVMVVPNAIIFLLFRKSEEFVYLYNRFGKIK